MKKQPTKFEKIMQKLVLLLGISVFLLLFYSIYLDIKDGSFVVESAAKKYAKSNEQENYCCSNVINQEKAVAFIGYDCARIKCNGRYYVFLNKINGKWAVDESTKKIIWGE
jgi:hypothetical protein